MRVISSPVVGQRWASDTEPELGLGRMVRVQRYQIEVDYAAAGIVRVYAWPEAPLHRVSFSIGDRIARSEGDELAVTGVAEQGGLITYHCGTELVPEGELADHLAIRKPLQRLLAGQADEDVLFRLRLETLYRQKKIRQSMVRGFTGGRLDLIPHQLFIAAEVAARPFPRVLLADEVGLGKTIEACLILHRLHLTGRASRVLILVPDALVHQWFVELLRRFHLLFSLFDEARCLSLEAVGNPFLDSQLVIAPVSLLAGKAERAEQAASAGWDLLIVDEAHHLMWDVASPSPEWQAVAALAAVVPGLLLLTATPQQLGAAGHFARLHLLDPVRYPHMEGFVRESEVYERTATALQVLRAGGELSGADAQFFAQQSSRMQRLLHELAAGEEEARAGLMATLLDSFGSGRVMFRNTRRVLTGFPPRHAHLYPLARGEDVRLQWLVSLLRSWPEAKCLLICHERTLVESLKEAVQTHLSIRCGVFHEGLTLLQRDRQAAWFADEEGAQLLLCSEIGSEGRNFQFAHHLVLYDLPDDVGLLEQRIGRLDRIGQTEAIHIHIPYETGTSEEVLARYYHEGLDCIEHCRSGTEVTAASTAGALHAAMDAGVNGSMDLASLLATTREAAAQHSAQLAKGWDYLLELQSCGSEAAEALITAIRAADADDKMEGYTMRLLEHSGMAIEDHGERTWLVTADHGGGVILPGISDGVMHATFDRAKALVREDLTFMTPDHPTLRGAMDQLLSSAEGNASCGHWPGGQGWLLEAIYLAECPAAAALQADRFISPSPLRVVVDTQGADWSADKSLLSAKLAPGDLRGFFQVPAQRAELTEAEAHAHALARAKLTKLTAAALQAMHSALADEGERLTALMQGNDHIRPAELSFIESQRAALAAAIPQTRLRLDSVRLILRAS